MANVKLGAKAVGSIVKIKENGMPVDFYVCKHDYESGLNGPGRTLLVRKDCYDQRQWHSSNVNAYASSAIDAWLKSTYKNLLDANIRTAMGTTKIHYTPGNNNWNVTTMERSVFLLSATELGQSRTYMKAEGTALSSTVVNLLKIAYLNGSAVVQWTRSPYTLDANDAWRLGSSGSLVDYCSNTNGSRPAFTLPSSLYVSDDGTVLANTAPSTPPGITVGEPVNGGASCAVSWTVATDPEGNLDGYTVERSTDGGSTWTQIYQGGGLSTSNFVAFGTETVMYRVRAYDSEGLTSGWRTSGQAAVVNNTAPTAPAGITVPLLVLGGGPLTVAWGAAQDSDGDLSGYALERQVDGGAWTQVYSGAAQTFTDAVTRGWSTVAYRVRAYDSHGEYSGYTASTAREVDNNVAPVITCATASGADLGTKSEGFTLDYSASDADGDAVAVTESMDSQTVRQYTAGAGMTYTFSVTGEAFMKLLNGPHTMVITASDGKAEGVHSVSFTKSVTAASVTLEEPMEADAQITICVLSVTGHIPADAAYSVKVTNNANDSAPVWEDCTTEVKNGGNHIFTNKTAAGGFAFNFLVEVERGDGGEGGYINSVQGGFQ